MAKNELTAGDRRLLAVVDAACAEAVRRSGNFLACRPGCTECCMGPFPITALDAARLSAGLAELSRRDPVRAARLRERARDSVASFQRDFPGDPSRGVLADDEDARDAFFRTHSARPCPALDPESGRCEVYAHRPLSCRTFGPPMRIEGQALEPCHLCFRGAAPDEVDAARVDLDCHALEEPLTARAETAAGGPGETLVAFALDLP